MDAFSEVGPTVTDNFITALTKRSSTQKALDIRLNEMSKKVEECYTALTNQVENFILKMPRKIEIRKVNEANPDIVDAKIIINVVTVVAMVVDIKEKT